jgi:2-polyprenyl-3-methyl-5-hydroxy-6-metoxy-1,4-benzoquinol methylase
MNGQIAIVGHTVQRTGRILDLPHLKCIDTGCGHGGLLTAMHVESGQVWQVNEAGTKRCTTNYEPAASGGSKVEATHDGSRRYG